MAQLHLIKTVEDLRLLSDYIKDKEFISIDTETTGLDDTAEVIGYSICAENDVAYYVITAYWSPEEACLKYLETKDATPEFLKELKGKQLIGHNILFDIGKLLDNYKVDLIDSVYADTMIMAHLLDENRQVGLKELGVNFYGGDAKKEQEEMHASVTANGGQLTKSCYELYKGDCDLIGKYGAKDTILTWDIYWRLISELMDEGLDNFYFHEECMPLLVSATWQLNRTGLRVDLKRVAEIKREMEVQMLEHRDFIYSEIDTHITEEHPGGKGSEKFNINSGAQLAWLLFEKMGEPFPRLSAAGKELAAELNLSPPYSAAARKAFIDTVKEGKGRVWREAGKVWDKKTRRYKGEGKIKDYWGYLSTDKDVIGQFAKKFKWCAALLEFKKLDKLLSTYVSALEEKTHYNIIRPNFLQHGTTSGRYSCRHPNFQNLPRDDKRIKSCIVAREGRVFVGADYSQLEPRVFASVSQDPTLMSCFKSGEDFYSVVGAPMFEKRGLSMVKDHSKSFAKKHPDLRAMAKQFALATVYGTSAWQQSRKIHLPVEECQKIIDRYLASYPKVEQMMLESHEQAKKDGVVYNLFGRPRRIPEAKKIKPEATHAELPYEQRTLLNLGMNHRVQSTAASIMNRAAIRLCGLLKDLDAKIVLQIHDEIVVECPQDKAEQVSKLMKKAMETTVVLPGVALIADPKIASNLAELK